MKKQRKISRALTQWSYDNKKANRKLLQLQKSFAKLEGMLSRNKET